MHLCITIFSSPTVTFWHNSKYIKTLMVPKLTPNSSIEKKLTMSKINYLRKMFCLQKDENTSRGAEFF